MHKNSFEHCTGAPRSNGRNATDNVVPGPRRLKGCAPFWPNFRSGEVEFQTIYGCFAHSALHSCQSCIMPSGISDDLSLLCAQCFALLSIMYHAHRRYESFDPFCASTTMTPKEGSVGATGVATSFWRKSCAGAPFRNRGRKVSNSSFEEVLGGSAISKSNPKVSKSFEIVFSKKYQAKPPFRNGHTVWHLKF